jgi:heme/copper-type cytochrome/quinol oxidase subunit 4
MNIIDVIPIIGLQERVYSRIKGQAHAQKEGFGSSSAGSIIGSILGLIISCIAAYLSWDCNSKQNVNFVLKIIFAFFAAIFGLFYIFLYMLFLSRACGASGTSLNTK